jgi:hypothetical protein
MNSFRLPSVSVAVVYPAILLLLVHLLAGWLAANSTPSEAFLLRAVLILLLGLQLMPAAPLEAPLPGGHIALWSALCGVVFLAGLALDGFSPGALAALVPMAGGLVLLLMLFGSLAALLSQLCRDRRIGSRLCTIALLLTISLPLWASPLVQTAAGGKMTDLIIALCPVSYLAVLADVDFLRSEWWYRHMPYGGMRYSYPDALPLTLAALAALAAIATLGMRQAGPEGFRFPRFPLQRR